MNFERDPLTGLSNRARGLAQLEQALDEAKQQGQTAAVLFADIDHFKSLNCSLGHYAGDVVLRQLADAVQRIVTGKGTLCRFGTDEFFVVLPSASAADAKDIAEQICDHLARQPMDVGSQVVHIAVTIGVASYPANGQDGDSLLRAAEDAVLGSKKSGRRGTISTGP